MIRRWMTVTMVLAGVLTLSFAGRAQQLVPAPDLGSKVQPDRPAAAPADALVVTFDNVNVGDMIASGVRRKLKKPQILPQMPQTQASPLTPRQYGMTGSLS